MLLKTAAQRRTADDNARPCTEKLQNVPTPEFDGRDDDSYEMCRAYVLPNLRDSVERTYPIFPESFQTRREQHPGPMLVFQPDRTVFPRARLNENIAS
ncbi:unnamed protein product [Prunus armeniaca]|nr:hypothetical protein GBA52_029091 [Prunus armeniaca]KAH0969397.1 hypothetical protein GBA52_028767 [Prunus armeniaca]CAB4280625.1 unnamed protein product [Prunus armeniaca]CAB4289960.1 unnamed protein product [Prunus armeniaca]CAB4320322.1 unnamed protein product [Prunus armeniaca]